MDSHQKKITARSSLIKRLVIQEHRKLNLHRIIPNSHNSRIETTAIDKVRRKLLEKEKKNISMDIKNDPVQFVCRNKYNNIEIMKNKSNIFPAIRKRKIDTFLSTLNSRKGTNSYQKELNRCLQLMNSSAKPLWTSPSYIMKAVNDSILNRKWNNLTHLLLMLNQLPSKRYKPLIRHLCQVMDQLHPVIQENDLQGQFKIICQANKR